METVDGIAGGLTSLAAAHCAFETALYGLNSVVFVGGTSKIREARGKTKVSLSEEIDPIRCFANDRIAEQGGRLPYR